MRNSVLKKGLFRLLVMVLLASVLCSLSVVVIAEGTVSTVVTGLDEPQGIAQDVGGHLYFTDGDGIWRTDSNGANQINLNNSSGYFWGIAVTSTYIYYSDDASDAVWRMDLNGSNQIVLSNIFNNPGQIALDSSGHIWIADSGQNAIWRTDVNGSNSIVVGSGFSYPYGVAVNDSYVFVADTGHGLIKRMSLTGTDITPIGGAFNDPFGVAVDSSGKVYVADAGDNAVYRMDSDGSNRIMLGAASDFQPKGLTVDISGNVYVADTYNDAIKKVTMTVTKLPQAAPAAPAVASKTDTSVTLATITGAEYRVGSGAWQTSPTFTGLSANTEYTFYARMAETETHEASPASTGSIIRTAKPPVAAPPAPTSASKTDTSVTLTAITGAEYRVGSGAWQTIPTFTGLLPNTEYTFYARIAETETTAASPASTGLVVRTDKTTIAAPAAPQVGSATATSITLKTVAGAEYRLGSGAWQTSPTFTGLQPSTTYSFTMRIAETATAYASPSSEVLSATTAQQLDLDDTPVTGEQSDQAPLFIIGIMLLIMTAVRLKWIPAHKE